MERKRLQAIEVSGEVTWEDIRYGFPSNECICPLAVAIERALNSTWTEHQFGYIRVRYGGAVVCVETDDYRNEELHATLSDPLKQFIRRFDAHRPVQPFSFRIYFRTIN